MTTSETSGHREPAIEVRRFRTVAGVEEADSYFDRVTAGGVTSAIASAIAGSALDLWHPGAGAPTAVGLHALLNFAGQAYERQRAKTLGALGEACAFGGVSPDELLERAGSDDRRSQFTVQALTAAARAGTSEKVRILGRALATGVLAKDDAVVDGELFIIEAFDRLEAPHVKVLARIAEYAEAQLAGTTQFHPASSIFWKEQTLRKVFPEAGATIPSILATLSRVGAIMDMAAPNEGSPSYGSTDFGRLLLQRYREAGSPEDELPRAGGAGGL